ncbi:unnamed protein product [Rotaria sp. Silwood2]|nr:unnamed protein product [Rotaria sp. Silwood2]CAF2583152.1 unnamed protein product [Rotaria sp. Silwood2]CAF3013721.1 unnamed protein product [Rotaria sp. Silwood2]CAF4173880.1 unnamed protein product [Rotaria sp. Silwood2]CAF4192419.1 unnamed protein product [Rotaria sp. Silwood2]
MLLKRFFERARTRCSISTNKQTCLCTAAKRDSLYDNPDVSLTKKNERQSTDHYGFLRKDKPTRLLMRRASMDESDKEDSLSITEKLRRASSQSPANIPMLVVVSFNPDEKGLQKKQIEIQRGFPVNAQYILNEWLFIKTADNEEGFVPYICCRPIFRRQSVKSLNNIEYSYKLHDFELQKSEQMKSPLMTLPILTPPTNKKFSLSTNITSPSYLFQKSSSYRRRQDFTSSSCGGDSGVSDCESSTNNHHCLDLSAKHTTNLSNLQSLHSSSNAFKKTGLVVQDLPLKKSSKTNQNKSQLLISSNSAFTQIVKKSQRQESNGCQPFPYEQNTLSCKNNSHRLYESYDETKKYHIDNNNNVSSPYIRRTPYTRRSLPYHTQSALKKPLYTKTSFSPDPFKKTKEQHLRNIVLAEPSLPPAIIPKKSTIERYFSDLSLNQIENDSLSPSTPVLSIHNRPSLSCSSSSASSSSSSATSSSTDDSTIPFIHIQMNNHRTGRLPVIYASSNITTSTITNNNNNNNNSDIQTKKSTSFIHNVSITV